MRGTRLTRNQHARPDGSSARTRSTSFLTRRPRACSPFTRIASPRVILLLHHRYRHVGGEERAVADLEWLIREHLHEDVEVLERDSSTIGAKDAALGLIRGGLRPDEVAQAVKRTNARVVHAHNVNPTYGWRALAAAQEAGRQGRAAPAQLPARVRGRHVLHARRGLHALPRAQHAPGPPAQLPRRLARRVRGLRGRARAAAATARPASRTRSSCRARSPAAPASTSARLWATRRVCSAPSSASSPPARPPRAASSCSPPAGSRQKKGSGTSWRRVERSTFHS